MNFLRYWSEKAAKEASRYLRVNRVNAPADTVEGHYKNILDVDNWNVDKNAQYFHLCQNETIEGIEYDQKITRKMIDKIKSENPNAVIVSDQSSVAGARDLHKENLWDDYGVIFFGVHKNFGSSGLTLALVSDEVVEKINLNQQHQKVPVPAIFDWTKILDMGQNLYYNTPSTITVQLT